MCCSVPDRPGGRPGRSGRPWPPHPAEPGAPPRVLVTTSWDDGHQLDTRLAAELAAHGFAATFYLAPRSAEIPPARRLSPAAVRDLATRFEIGAHTLTHPRLTRLPRPAAAREIAAGKAALEEITGLDVTSFCYPYGAYRAEHVAMVRAAGFQVARTIRRCCTGPPADLLRLGTTTHAARYLADGWAVIRGGPTLAAGWAAWRDWDVLARDLFQQARARGGVYHLWGHSWEIDAHRDWRRLRALLRYIAGHEGVTFVTNGQLAVLARGATPGTPGITGSAGPSCVGPRFPGQMARGGAPGTPRGRRAMTAAGTTQAPAVGPADGERPGPRSPGRAVPWGGVAAAAAVLAANAIALTGAPVPFLGPVLGFWLLVAYPVYLLGTTSVWRGAGAGERFGGSLCAVLLLLMLAGLVLNTVLPVLGVARPLSLVPVLLLANALTAVCVGLRRRYPPAAAWRPRWPVSPAAGRLIGGSGLSVALAVLGANRLNNGAGGQVSLAALGVVLAVAAVLFRWRHRVGDGTVAVTLYLLSLALLLLTSLRGWYVTGHDIQTEYRAFQLTYGTGRWDMATFRSAYNACLSVTILPAELAQLVRVSGPYLFKVFFQLIFAACPVLVYTVARRHWQRWAAILAAVYFAGFPVFFTDMPFLCRQEVALLFTCAVVLAITQPAWGVRARRAAAVAACLGVELSHYSTMYLLLGTLAVTWLAVNADRARLAQRMLPRPGPARPQRALSAGLVVAATVIVVAWGGLATHTAGSLLTDGRATVESLAGRSPRVRAGTVSYGLLGGASPTGQQVLNGYRRDALRTRAAGPRGVYLPLSLVNRYPVPLRPSLRPMPLTAAGRLLAAAGVPVARLDTVTRQAAARGEQVFAVVGLVTLLLIPRRRRRVGREFRGLCIGALAVVALITVLPDLSADYDVLRAFGEALIVIAPVLVAGSYIALRPAGAALAIRVSAVICLGLFASTTGFLPQLLGGYPAQLSLDDGGQYYDAYYTQPQEAAAVGWLAGQPAVLPDGVQAENFTDRFAFTAPGEVSGRQVIGDIFPPLIRRSSWVILGYATVRTGRASVFYDGDLISYRYPAGLLRAAKDLVYDNGGTQIYR